MVKSKWSDTERVVLGASDALKDRLIRDQKNLGTGTDRDRLQPRDFLSEAEHVMLQATNGMSLLDLKKDEKLHEDMLLLREFATQAIET